MLKSEIRIHFTLEQHKTFKQNLLILPQMEEFISCRGVTNSYVLYLSKDPFISLVLFSLQDCNLNCRNGCHKTNSSETQKQIRPDPKVSL